MASSASGLNELDGAENEAIGAVFGPEIAVVRPKAFHGETFGASGALAMGQALAWMRGAPAEPRVQGQAPEQVKVVMVLAVGFYGNVSAVLLRTSSEDA